MSRGGTIRVPPVFFASRETIIPHNIMNADGQL